MSEQHNNLDTQFILDLIGKQVDLQVVLHTVTEWLETQISDAMVSIMLYSEQDQHLNLISGGKHFSFQYINVLKNLKVGPHIGACGAAAYHRKMVICDQLATDKNWAAYQDIIQQENIAACWSMPIINAQGVLYGTFGTYYRQPKHPTDHHIKLLRRAASLVALSMDLQHAHQQKRAISDKYSSLFKYHPDTVLEHDLQGYILDANIVSKNILGFEIEKIKGLHYSQFILPQYEEATTTAFKLATEGNIQGLEIETYCDLGQTYWVELTYIPIIHNQQIIGVLGVVHDISHRRQTHEHLRLLKRGVDASPHGIVLAESTPNAPIVYVNPAFLDLTGYTEDEVLGKNCRFLQGAETDPVVVQQIKLALHEQREIKTTLKNYRKDGSWFWNQLILGPILDEQDQCTHFIGIQQDITQQRIDEEYINYQRTHDHLTQLVNRQTFEERLDLAFHLQHHNAETLVILYIDLDDFQPLNESLGYIVGDQLIKSVGERLQSVLQEGDILSRFTGDEFAILLSKRHDQKQVVLIAEEILKSLSQPFNVNKHKIHLSASIGIAADTPQTENFQELLQHAIHAMHQAKVEGRNTWYWHAESCPVNTKIDYVQLRHELMIALNDNQFKLVYQPIIETSSGQIKAVEALIRWNHPELGLILPTSFIPLAERTGQIVAIGYWVLQQACQDIVHLNQNRTDPISIAVNISPLQFRRTGFLKELQDVLRQSKLSAELLKLEVTEGMLIMGADRSIEILKSIRALGIKVAIDDFGTGYSSLSYLRQLPVDEIKLDRSFIEFLPQHDRDAAIVEAIINMANTLDLAIVAEGVETEEQVQFLTKHKCRYLQGYYFAKPGLLDDIKAIY